MMSPFIKEEKLEKKEVLKEITQAYLQIFY